MKAKAICFLLASVFLIGCQQNDDDNISLEEGKCWVEVNGNFIITEVDKVPEFINGGEEGFGTAVVKAINYPAEARENGIEGTVKIEYEITPAGTVENIVTTQDIGAGCADISELALETTTEGESFYPAELNDEKVRVKKELSIVFKLE